MICAALNLALYSDSAETDDAEVPAIPLTPVAHVRFVDATADSGLVFSHALYGETMASMVAGGVAIGDYNGDGLLDVYLAQGGEGTSSLFENRSRPGELRFVDVTEAAGVAGEASDKASGPTFADHDGDGDLDLFVGSVEGTSFRVFDNLGDGRFLETTDRTGLRELARENNVGMAFGDFDRDEDLDLFVAHWTFTEDELPTGSAQHLWRNNGDGTFTDVSEVSLVSEMIIEKPQDYTFSPTFADIDNDGDSDLLVVADSQTTQVLINDGLEAGLPSKFSTAAGHEMIDLGQFGGDFFAYLDAREQGLLEGVAASFRYATDRSVITDEAGMGSSVADFDNDGDLDWFVTSISLGDDVTGRPTGVDNAGYNLSGNRYYRNDGGAFTDQTATSGLRKGYWGWASCAADFNNDGYLDIFHVNGMDDPNTIAYLEDPSRLFINNADGTFTEYSEPLGLIDRKSGRGVTCFDGDQDGDIDILIANNNDTATLFRNDGGSQLNYLNVRLVGSAPNTQAVGARIYVTADGMTQMREVHNGSNYVSQNPTEQHFGLGNATAVSQVKVIWSDGRETSRLDVQPYQRVTVTYPDVWSVD